MIPPIDPPIKPTTHTPTHSWGVSANHKSSNRIELSWLGQDLFNFEWFDMAPPINPSIHPPTHQTIHQPIGGGVSTDFKSSNRIEISWLVQVLLKFYWFWGSPWRWGDGWMGWWGCPTYMSTCTCMHTCIHVYGIMGNSQGFPHGGCHL